VVTIEYLGQTGVFDKVPITRSVVFKQNSVSVGWTLLLLVDVVLAFVALVSAFVSGLEVDSRFLVAREPLVVSASFSQFIKSVYEPVSSFALVIVHLEEFKELDLEPKI